MGFFLLPFGFLIPMFLIFIAVRVGMRIFHDFFHDQTGRRRVGEPGGPGSLFELPRGRSYEARLFRLAYKLKGRITVSDIVLDTGLGVKEAEELVNGMVDGMRVRMEVDQKGMIVYEFPEILSRFEEG